MILLLPEEVFLCLLLLLLFLQLGLVLKPSLVFLQHSLTKVLSGVVADPFGASLCLVIAGVIFSKYLYKFNFSTLSTFYRKRYNRSIEVIITLIIILSYLGWVAAQITAIGLVLKVITNGFIGESLGMILGYYCRIIIYNSWRHVFGCYY